MKPLSCAASAGLAAWALACTAAWGAEVKPASGPDPVRGQQMAQICIACHTADGTRGLPVNPILQGQHAEYLIKQIREFKSGKRKNPIMQGMVAALPEEEIRHVAAFFASKSARAGFAKDKDTVALGEKIYRGGIAARHVPACAGCHSPTGAGIPAQYPRVAGQHGEYTEAQLIAFRTGTRANSPEMSAIAAKMSEREVKAVADYMAGLR